MSIPRWIYQFRGYFVSFPLVFALFFRHFETESNLAWLSGICLFLAGLALRVWAQQHLHYRLRVHKSLTITGPYVFVRNPIYIGNILIFVGGTLMSELVWLVPVTFFYCSMIYSLVARYEEANLLIKYGEPYREYMRHVPRWLPKIDKFKRLDLMNKYFFQSVAAESHCLLLAFFCVLKELVD